MREDERQHLRNNILNRGFRRLPDPPEEEGNIEEYENRIGDIVVLDWVDAEPEPALEDHAPFQVCGILSPLEKPCVSVLGINGRHKGDHRSVDGFRWQQVVCGMRQPAPHGVRPRYSKPCLYELGHKGDHRGEDGYIWKKDPAEVKNVAEQMVYEHTQMAEHTQTASAVGWPQPEIEISPQGVG